MTDSLSSKNQNAEALPEDLQQYMATCPKGMEAILAKELSNLGAPQVQESVAACYFSADLATAYSICLWTRLANRIVLLLGRCHVSDLKDFQASVASPDWSRWFSSDQTIAVDFNGSNQFIRDSRYGAQLTKDIINDDFVGQGSNRLVVDVEAPDVLVYVRLFKARFSIGLDMVGESLHRRAYRCGTGSAPLKENLAAAILMLANWPEYAEKSLPFIDPMCGSGTLLVEAALIANNISPSYKRDSWLLKKFKTFDCSLWEDTVTRAKESVLTGQKNQKILGFDTDPKAIALARQNIAAAGLENIVTVEHQSIEQLSLALQGDAGLVVVNPPYGKRLGEVEELKSLYEQLGDWLKRDCNGWEASIFTGNLDLGWSTRLRSWRQHALFNGSIPCQLQRYRISDKNAIKGWSPAADIVSESALSEAATMLANRIKKNLRKLKSWLKENPDCSYRVYDADLPEYAVAIDCYSGWCFDGEAKPDTHKEPQVFFHIQEYMAPTSIDTRTAEKRLSESLLAVSAVFKVKKEQIVVKQRMRQKGKSQYERQQIEMADMLVSEGEHVFIVNLGKYLDTGLFLDSRPIRRHIAQHTNGKRFLNLFAYTASATVYAAKAGAISSVSVDMSNTYLQWSRRNFSLNQLPVWQHQLVQADCLQWLKSDDKRFDCILLDPPSFSNSKRMADVFDVQRDHAMLIDLCFERLEWEGVLYFSNNKRGFRLDDSINEKYSVENITEKTHDPDFGRPKLLHQCWILRHAVK